MTHRLRPGALALFVGGITLCIQANAQFKTPQIDGTIGLGEYGNTQDGTNQIGTNTSQTWYMTWDANNLYVGITNANLSEAAVIYIDGAPVTPPQGGTNASGNLAGFNYDGTDFSTLPFRAQFVTYVKDGYREYRNSDGNGNWTNAIANYGAYASNGNGNVREFSIPWTAINANGRPASFLFFGYLTSSGGYVYGQVPNDNAGAFIGTTATYAQYYAVTNTANGASTLPFSNEQSSSTIDFSGLFHNTFDPYYRSVEGAVPAGTAVTLRFRTAHLGATSTSLRTYLFDTATGNTAGPNDTPMTFLETRTENGTVYDEWTVSYTTPSTPTIVYYKFQAFNATSSGWYSDDYIDDYDNLNKDGTGKASGTEPFDSFQITAYDPNFQTPAWMADTNLYFIFPDRFRNGSSGNDYCVPGSSAGCPSFYGAGPQANIAVTTWNTLLCDPRNLNGPCPNNYGSIFYGGDLLGIQNQLDYIQGLGFDSLYLNPIFQASSNHRYDTDDFLTIDPALGGNSAFTSLITEMNKRGMRIILDGVFNHASSDSLYFNEYNRFPSIGACQSLSSPYRTWFHFNDNNVPCTPADYQGWYGLSSLPTFDHTQSEVQNFFYSGSRDNVMLHWYNQGAGGWRFDVAPDPNFPFSWWIATRQYAKTYNPSGPLIGEIWPNASQWLGGNGLDSVMNYRFRRNLSGFVRWPYGWVDENDNGNDSIIPLTPSQFDTANRAIRDDYPAASTAAMMNLIDSHDTNRALFVFTEQGDNGLVQAKQRLELAALFQFTYIGAPTVFYGDEAAINAPSRADGPNGPIGDPYSRAPYPWLDQPGDPGIYGPPDQTVLSFYKLVAHLRKQHASLRSGVFTTLLTGDTQQASTAANTYAFARTGASETAIVALNNGSVTNTPVISVGAYYPDGTVLRDALTGSTYSVSAGSVSLSLPPISGAVLLLGSAPVDLTPPTGTIALHPAPNGFGWINQSPVLAVLNGNDVGSGVNQIRYWVDNGSVTGVSGTAATAVIRGEGKHTVSLRVIDNAGNISNLVTAAVNIDLTDPVVTVTGVAAGANYAAGSVPAPGCTTADSVSGVAVQASPITTNTGNGTWKTTCVGGADKAGNIAKPVSVTYMISAAAMTAIAGSHTNNPDGKVTLTLSLKNTGFGTVADATIASLTSISVVAGSGTVNVLSGVPANLGTIASGASASTGVNFTWPQSATRIQFTVNFTAGRYSGSTVLNVSR